MGKLMDLNFDESLNVIRLAVYIASSKLVKLNSMTNSSTVQYVYLSIASWLITMDIE